MIKETDYILKQTTTVSTQLYKPGHKMIQSSDHNTQICFEKGEILECLGSSNARFKSNIEGTIFIHETEK